MHTCESLDHFRRISERLITEYNEQRPHDSVKGLLLDIFREMLTREV